MESETSLVQLLPNEILEIILGFSDFESVKCFRLVCRRWNCAAQLYLPKVSTLCLLPMEKKNFDDFNATFERALTDFPFSSFKLKCKENNFLSWNHIELDEFLEKWHHAIKSLEFDQVKIHILVDDRVCRLAEYDILSNHQSGLETLIINCCEGTPISVEVCNLTSIKVIKLSCGVILEYDKETKLTPTIIELRETIFRKSNVHLNDFVDFSKAKRVCIHQTYGENEMPQFPKVVTLEMTNAITLDDLDLKNVRLHEMHRANWEIKGLLSLSQIPWREKNQMKFTNLNFQSHEINISTLPQTIEYIGLADAYHGAYVSTRLTFLDKESQPFFPNLKFVMSNYHDIFPKVFKNCPKLTEINFYRQNNFANTYLNDYYTNNLPCTLSKMHIEREASIVSLDEQFQVNTLIVHGYIIPFCLQRRHYHVISCKKLVMILSGVEYDLRWLIEEIHSLQKNKNHKDTVVYIGPVKRQRLVEVLERVDKSPLNIQNVLSSNSEEYWLSFEHKIGKAISKAEFDRLSKFSQGYIPLPNYVNPC